MPLFLNPPECSLNLVSRLGVRIACSITSVGTEDAIFIWLSSMKYKILSWPKVHFIFSMPALRLGNTAPDFSAETTAGPIKFHDWIGDSWVYIPSWSQVFYLSRFKCRPSSFRIPVTLPLSARRSSGKSLDELMTLQNGTSRWSVSQLMGWKIITDGSLILTSSVQKLGPLMSNSLLWARIC